MSEKTQDELWDEVESVVSEGYKFFSERNCKPGSVHTALLVLLVDFSINLGVDKEDVLSGIDMLFKEHDEQPVKLDS